MQPHSMSALAVANYIFAFRFGLKIPRVAEVGIEFDTPEGTKRTLYHVITQIEPIKDKESLYPLGVKVGVKTTDGSICTVTVKRKTNGEFKSGEEVVATHSVQHRAGLEEHYKLGRSSIQGFHRNSLKYGQFGGSVANEQSFTLICEVKSEQTGLYKKIPYRVKFKTTA